jgi:hypothetical protein
MSLKLAISRHVFPPSSVRRIVVSVWRWVNHSSSTRQEIGAGHEMLINPIRRRFDPTWMNCQVAPPSWVMTA